MSSPAFLQSSQNKKKLTLNSYAKLNLYLAVLGKRKDNYHNIETIFERIDLADKISLTLQPHKKIRIICNNPGIPCDKKNLCYRSAELLQSRFNINCGVEIEIKKHIPAGAGLGGGSGNAAAVLLGLNKLWNLALSQNKLVSLARLLGSDVPFFIYGIPFAKGSKRGDYIRPLKALNSLELHHILVVPKIKVSTPLIYKKWDEYSGLTRGRRNDRITTLASLKSGLFLNFKLHNSLEEITARFYPEVRFIREKLVEFGLKLILMSGSGPAVFGIVSSRKEALSIRRKLLRLNRSWLIFVTSTR